ncbi:hypothetical protein [Reyranella sp. CPCC 100927]|uniref:hypothetical protein n=1 Tax=Reyranella sp. CPCC 100927 TaxID=2599616 RepID=UPI0011B4FD38|nr:hypothetical protein [Reyranella sp. CPCC 100927]TWT13839.1 hypothetical protein FQU96_07995 [Reyranella sp. CPCC 100927]
MSEDLFLNLPAGPGCERCASRTYVASIEPHPDKPRHTRHVFECPRCYHLTRMTVGRRGGLTDAISRASRHVSNADLLVERQMRLIKRLHAQGRDIARAEALLEVLQESAHALRRYHDYLLSRVEPSTHDPSQ